MKLILLLLTGILSFPAIINCDCEDEFLDEMDADWVVQGKVINISADGDNQVVFIMTDESMIQIYTPSEETYCNFPFEKGTDYIVFAYYNEIDGYYGPEGSFYTTSCSYTMTMDEWDAFLEGY